MDIGEGLEITDEEQTDVDSSVPNSPFRTYLSESTSPQWHSCYGYHQVPSKDSVESPRSLSLVDDSEFAGFRPPSSINLNASIEEELNQRLLNEYNKLRGFSSFSKAPSMVTVSPDDHAVSMLDLNKNGFVANGDNSDIGRRDMSSLSLGGQISYVPVPTVAGVILRSNSEEPIRKLTSNDGYVSSSTTASTPSADDRGKVGNQIAGMCDEIGRYCDCKWDSIVEL